MKLSIIVAASENFGIGINGSIPWKLRKEMAHFAKMTTMTLGKGKQNAVIMGRKTWESIPEKFRPLKERTNIVLTHAVNSNYPSDVVLCSSFQEALQFLEKPPLTETIENVWVIGGSSVYQEAMKSSLCHRLYVTWIKKSFECDTFFPKIPDEFKEIKLKTLPCLAPLAQLPALHIPPCNTMVNPSPPQKETIMFLQKCKKKMEFIMSIKYMRRKDIWLHDRNMI